MVSKTQIQPTSTKTRLSHRKINFRPIFVIFDIFLCIILYILVILILCGYLSLCERKFLAVLQMRVGPGLFFFGVLTPITDGLKLFIKFTLFIINLDTFYFILCCITLVYTLFVI